MTSKTTKVKPQYRPMKNDPVKSAHFDLCARA